MNLPEFLTRLPDGEIRLAGHRIGLYHLVLHYNEGESAEMLACRYPTLSLSLVHKVLGFYLENQPEVEAYVRSCAAKADQQQREAHKFNFDALRQRLAKAEPLAPGA